MHFQIAAIPHVFIGQQFSNPKSKAKLFTKNKNHFSSYLKTLYAKLYVNTSKIELSHLH